MSFDLVLNLFCGSDAKEIYIQKGTCLFHAESNIRSLFRVVRGQLFLVRQTSAGTSVILQRARVGDILAEASVYASTYHCDARAVEESVVISLPLETFKARLNDDADVANAWVAHLAREIQSARMKAEIRTLRTVSERLDAWLAEYGSLPDKGMWQNVAGELGVSREALYRELARRRNAGL